jgi:hypothetical protein
MIDDNPEGNDYNNDWDLISPPKPKKPSTLIED